MAFDLGLGAIDLLAPGPNTSPGYWFMAGGDNMDLGSPQAVERVVTSFLQDGSIATIESWDNRTLTLPIAVCATSAANLAAGEAALAAEVGVRNLLTYTPSGNGQPCVFDVVNSTIAVNVDDVLELATIQRNYTLTVTALPFSRAGLDVTSSWAAPPAGTPTVTTVDACTSTTGWTGTPNTPSAAVVVGSISESMTGAGVQTVTLTRSSLSASMTSTPFVRIDMSASFTQGPISAGAISVKINGTAASPVATSGTVAWYAMPGGATTLTSVAFSLTSNLKPTTTFGILVADISRSSASADVTSQFQTFRSVPLQGSARTQAAVALADASGSPAGLGSVLVYTTPNTTAMAQPNLRVWKASSNPAETTDSTVVSGKTSQFTGAHTFLVPASQVPAGTYQVMARLKHASAGTYNLTSSATSGMNGVATLDTPAEVPTYAATFTLAAATWAIVPMGVYVLPTKRMGSLGFVGITLGPASSTGLTLDEAWLFNLDTGRLSWIECGAGTPAQGSVSTRVWLDPASLSTPVPQASVGIAADRSDSYDCGSFMGAFAEHDIAPPSVNVFTVVTGSVNASGSLTYSPRFQTHVV